MGMMRVIEQVEARGSLAAQGKMKKYKFSENRR